MSDFQQVSFFLCSKVFRFWVVGCDQVSQAPKIPPDIHVKVIIQPPVNIRAPISYTHQNYQPDDGEPSHRVKTMRGVAPLCNNSNSAVFDTAFFWPCCFIYVEHHDNSGIEDRFQGM